MMPAPSPTRAAALVMLMAGGAWAGDAPEPPMGDDGLHKAPWIETTFLDLRADMEEAAAAGRRLLVMVEQRGCIYCTRMHKEVFVQDVIDERLREDYFVLQINMFGDVEVTDFDGVALPEKEMVRRWGVMFTPTLLFFPEDPGTVPPDATAAQAAVATMPGAFEADTTLHLFDWVLESGYAGDEPFQKYHARRLTEATAQR